MCVRSEKENFCSTSRSFGDALHSDDEEDILETKPVKPTNFVGCNVASRNERDGFGARAMRAVTVPQQKMMEQIFLLPRVRLRPRRSTFLDIPCFS
mmetsp:Transcript_16051/g.37207  ORF Transcript_16051/g.37207 Transcript_16051/m.37207 type:complete len:96 (-) Transcript_16051:105-392(-)